MANNQRQQDQLHYKFYLRNETTLLDTYIGTFDEMVKRCNILAATNNKIQAWCKLEEFDYSAVAYECYYDYSGSNSSFTRKVNKAMKFEHVKDSEQNLNDLYFVRIEDTIRVQNNKCFNTDFIKRVIDDLNIDYLYNYRTATTDFEFSLEATAKYAEYMIKKRLHEVNELEKLLLLEVK